MEEMNQLVVFKLGDEMYGVSITKVKEIIEMKDICPIPETPAYIEGLLNIRGEIHIIFNLCKKFEIKRKETSDNYKIILVNDKKAGFIVDNVSEIIQVEKKDIETTSGLISELCKQYIDGIAKVGENIIVILNLGRILNVQDEIELEKVSVNQLELSAK